MGRTGLILRQWVERDGCYVLAKQAYAWDTGDVITSRTETLRVFRFENEWRAKLCDARMSTYKESRRKNWLRYFERHVDAPMQIVRFRVAFPDVICVKHLLVFAFFIAVVVVFFAEALKNGWIV